MRALIDLAGKTFGCWTVIKRDETYSRLHNSNTYWECLCNKCGRTLPIFSCNLRNGKTTQCRWCKIDHDRLRPYESLFNNLSCKAEVTITYEQFVSIIVSSENRCHYCHADVTFAMYNTKANGQATNLDRKDSSSGYSAANVVVCCWRCNEAKSNTFTYQEWYGMTTYFRNQMG